MTTVSWRALVDAAKARDQNPAPNISYQFSNGREFTQGENPYAWADDIHLPSGEGVFPLVFDDEGDGIGDIEF